MIIVIDFDGTCVTHEYPKVGQDIGAIPNLEEIIDNKITEIKKELKELF